LISTSRSFFSINFEKIWIFLFIGDAALSACDRYMSGGRAALTYQPIQQTEAWLRGDKQRAMEVCASKPENAPVVFI
jgi:hypothetical protein